MAKSTRYGGASNKDVKVQSSVVTHPKRGHDSEEEVKFQETEETQEIETDDYDEWTATQLRDELANRQLSASGRKPELIERLRSYDSEVDDNELEPTA